MLLRELINQQYTQKAECPQATGAETWQPVELGTNSLSADWNLPWAHRAVTLTSAAVEQRPACCRFNAESVQQTERRWRDGSLEEDLPMRSLSEMFNVNYFLVSQTNPHIVPALNLKKRVNRTLGNVVETEWKHR